MVAYLDVVLHQSGHSLDDEINLTWSEAVVGRIGLVGSSRHLDWWVLDVR